MLPPDLEALYTNVHNLCSKELDELPHGAIQLDKDGKILSFNRYESDLSAVSYTHLTLPTNREV